MGLIIGIGVCIALFAIGRYIVRDSRESMDKIAENGDSGLFWFCLAIAVIPVLIGVTSHSDLSAMFFFFFAGIVFFSGVMLKVKCVATAITAFVLYFFMYDYFELPSFFAFVLAITLGGLMFFVDLCLWDVFERKEKKSRPKIRPRIKSKSPTIRPNKVK